MFHKVVWQRMQGVVGFLITVLLQISRESDWKNFENQLRFDKRYRHEYGLPLLWNMM